MRRLGLTPMATKREPSSWQESFHACQSPLSEPAASGRSIERVEGIEPPPGAWKAPALPLSYTRVRLVYSGPD